ncbi:hypothetical protein [Streptococcus suis]|uniref:hypothetical protein n=1 Tax=Streptococcus suis TaxID=1307 RepID=UPI000C17DE54|nr:hypothetical protein [Streptococcus suis]AUC91160.1 hypothetical protein CWM22_04160 [Streptococcus suis]AUC92126.1 hypothetical protein CWM22_09580 [Streptococcus suis]NQM04644.1 hypothetical protein [Streptococcus suis]HEM4275739.1 hypothetical protein [Streptococcus suis]HEM4952630.1 hypothetical protein [Streptococcus suis]
MNQEQLNQALALTNQELANQLAEEKNTKNLLAVQLTEAQQTIAGLQAEITELTKQLDEATKPAEEIIEGE